MNTEKNWVTSFLSPNHGPSDRSWTCGLLNAIQARSTVFCSTHYISDWWECPQQVLISAKNRNQFRFVVGQSHCAGQCTWPAAEIAAAWGRYPVWSYLEVQRFVPVLYKWNADTARGIPKYPEAWIRLQGWIAGDDRLERIIYVHSQSFAPRAGLWFLCQVCNHTEMQEDVESMTRYLEAIDSIERYVTNKKRSPAKSQKSISQEVFAAVAENKSPADHWPLVFCIRRAGKR